MMNSREKGKKGEREFASLCRDKGFSKVHRTQQYCGNTGDAADVVGLPGVHAEVKRVENLNIYNAVEQAKRDSQKSGRVPVVFHRRNNHEWLAIMTADAWFEMYRESELLNSNDRENDDATK